MATQAQVNKAAAEAADSPGGAAETAEAGEQTAKTNQKQSDPVNLDLGVTLGADGPTPVSSSAL